MERIIKFVSWTWTNHLNTAPSSCKISLQNHLNWLHRAKTIFTLIQWPVQDTRSIQLPILFYSHSWSGVHRDPLRVAKNRVLLLCRHLLPIAVSPSAPVKNHLWALFPWTIFFLSDSPLSLSLFSPQRATYFCPTNSYSTSFLTRSGPNLIQVSVLSIRFRVNTD